MVFAVLWASQIWLQNHAVQNSHFWNSSHSITWCSKHFWKTEIEGLWCVRILFWKLYKSRMQSAKVEKESNILKLINVRTFDSWRDGIPSKIGVCEVGSNHCAQVNLFYELLFHFSCDVIWVRSQFILKDWKRFTGWFLNTQVALVSCVARREEICHKKFMRNSFFSPEQWWFLWLWDANFPAPH